MPRVFLTAEWRHLLMVNFEVDPGRLAPYVPRGTTLDRFNGRTLVSVVGFRFLHTRVLGVPVPFHRHFDEVNLRFYVVRKRAGEWLKGVVFVKELVPRRAIAWTARRLYNENYTAVPMRSTVEVPGRVEYAWRRGPAWESVSARVVGAPFLPAAGSEEAFVSEHYWGYVRQRDEGTVEYQVTHPQWRVYTCEDAGLECDVSALYGPTFAEALAQRPVSAFLAEGSAVAVHRGHPL
jgi:uncharacterized protein YqjF (DUF2071 family)